VDGLRASLAQGRRLILEAPAGRGKTTTLLQIAQRTLPEGGLPFLVDLPFWVRTGTEIVQYIAQTPAFAKRGLDAPSLLQLRGVEPFVFLLNGWNEISEGTAESAAQALRELEQNYPSAGIVVATRTHRLRPPLPGAFRAQLLTLRRSQRDQYLVRTLGQSANELVPKLNNSQTIDELTRTPLILAEVAELFLKGQPIPSTKMGILSAVMRVLEESEEHYTSLQQAPLAGHAREYLSALSMAMTEGGAVEISEAEGRAVINSRSTAMEKAGRLGERPEATAVLNELAKHHVLERMNFPGTTFRFQHQQFQEFFAANALGYRLVEVGRGHDADVERRFATRYVNEPRWGESLRLFAEDVKERRNEPELTAAGARLVRMALHVDPIFSADLANASGPTVWEKVRDGVGRRLRDWYAQKDLRHRRCALAAMLATGADDFKDVIIPLLTDSNDQVRLAVYHGVQVLPENLGPNWRDAVHGWPENARINFVRELARNPWLADQVEDFALADASPKVKWSAAQMLNWYRFTEKAERLLKSIEDEHLREALHRAQPDDIPQSQWPRVVAIYEQMRKEAGDPFERLRLLHVMQAFRGADIVDKMKAELDGLRPDQLKPGDKQGHITWALEVVHASDPKWVSDWATRKVLDMSIWLGPLRGLITHVAGKKEEELYARFSSEVLDDAEQRHVVSVLASVMNAELAARVFGRACEISRGLSFRPGHDQAKWKLFGQLKDLLRTASPAIFLDGISTKLEQEPDKAELDVMADILPATSITKPDVRSSVSEEMRLKLRAYLKRAARLGADPDGLRADTRAEVAQLLANVGEQEDLGDIRHLIEADSVRLQKAQAAWIAGDRSQDATGYGHLFLGAVTTVDPAGADDIIVNLLMKDPQYVYILPERLPGLARRSTEQQAFDPHRLDHQRIWRGRSGQPDERFVEERRARFADALLDQIKQVQQEREAATDKRAFEHRLKLWGGALAALDGRRSSKLVLEIMELPCRSDGWTRVGVIESLLSWGVALNLDEVLRILHPVREDVRASGYNDQYVWLFARCLSVLAFVDPPAAGIAQIRQLISEHRYRPYDLGGVLAALGASRCDEAVDLLLEFARADGKGVESLGEQWILAIGMLEGARSNEILLSFVDPDVKVFDREFIPDHRHGDLLARLLAERAFKDKALKSRLFELAQGDLSKMKRMLLAKVFGQFVDEDDRIQGLAILRDDELGVAYELVRSMEKAFSSAVPMDPGATHTHSLRSDAMPSESDCSRWRSAIRIGKSPRSPCSVRSSCGASSMDTPPTSPGIL
jgi:hypothetical protein